MKLKIFLVAVALLSLSPGCDYLKEPGLGGRPRWYIKSPPPINDVVEVPEGYNMYVTAFEYPDGYDYIRDTLHGAGASIVLYRDGEKVLSMPADGISPDECRVVDGRLYTPVSSGGKTRMLCDGEPLFSYDGEEAVGSIVSDGESVYTLGRSLTDGGFCCRKDGAVLYSVQKGTVVGPADGDGALRLDGDDCVFFYSVPMVSVGGQKSLYYMVRNGEQTQLNVPVEVSGVFDAVRMDGTVYVAASVSLSAGRAALYCDGSRVVLAQTAVNGKLSGLRLFFLEDQVYVTGFLASGGKMNRMVWNASGKVVFRIECYDFHWIYPAPAGYYAVERKGDEILFSLGTTTLFQTQARFWGSRCAEYFGGGFHAALLDPDGKSSTLYRSDGTAAMTVKGLITEVCYSALILPGDDP
ncbi:MAG: hypothetical protein IK045_06575 [Bacteroidales bacterium]|nr:hypothetical protein [Bacteroidales bacterium]